MVKKNRMDTHQWDCAMDPEIVPLVLALHWAQAQAMQCVRPLWSRHGLTAAEFDVLATLRNAAEPHQMTPSAIQDEVVITSGGLTKVMLQLAERGLVERLRRAGDQRVKPVCLTPAGKAVIENALAEAVAASGRWVRSQLSQGEVATLTRLLGKLVEGAD